MIHPVNAPAADATVMTLWRLCLLAWPTEGVAFLRRTTLLPAGKNETAVHVDVRIRSVYVECRLLSQKSSLDMDCIKPLYICFFIDQESTLRCTITKELG